MKTFIEFMDTNSSELGLILLAVMFCVIIAYGVTLLFDFYYKLYYNKRKRRK